MNYFEFHIGDYAAATSHLTFIEDAAFSRLLRIYYRDEKPLPAEVKAVQRLAGARTKEERESVDVVLKEFFALEDDGWHNRRADAEVARYVAGEPERQAKKQNELSRLGRHREERATLFSALTNAGQHAPWNIGISDLRALVATLPATAAATATETFLLPLRATAAATPATATHTQYPVLEEKISTANAVEVPGKPGTVACPHAEIVKLYHEVLPSLAKVCEWTDFRRALLRKRWTENPERQSLDWWHSFFGYVSESDFLMGRTSSRDGSRPFECDLEWLIRPSNFVKVIEGKYHNN